MSAERARMCALDFFELGRSCGSQKVCAIAVNHSDAVSIDRGQEVAPCTEQQAIETAAGTANAHFLAMMPACGALVFDTETTGIRGHVIQFAMVALDRQGRELCVYDKLWLAPVEIDPRAEKVHGISAERLRAAGVCPVGELAFAGRVFAAARDAGAKLVAHNARFDCERLGFTAAYYGATAPVRVEDTLCTMRGSTAHCGFVNVKGHRKAPKCSELFLHLFGREYDGPLHDALGDSRMTASCYTQGARLGWW